MRTIVRQRTLGALHPCLCSGLQREAIIDETLGNRLLAALPRVERQSVLAHCELDSLASATWLDADSAVAHCYFPVDCAISLVVPSERRVALEVGAIGCEGMFGPHSGAQAEGLGLKGFVQGAGQAWRIDASSLLHLSAGHERLNALLRRYSQVLLVQTARSVACGRFHSLEQRLARWLLAHTDRAWSSELAVTHDQLAMLLGARRAGVTVALGQMEERALVAGGRGRVRVADRAGLVQASCSCYVQDRETYERAMDVPPSRRKY